MSSYQEKAIEAKADLSRLAVGQKFLASGRTVQLLKMDDTCIIGLAEKKDAAPYKFTIDLLDINNSTCICGTYLANKNRGIERRDKLCSHQCAGLIVADNGAVTVTIPTTPTKVRTLKRIKTIAPVDPNVDPDNDPDPVKRSYAFKAKLHRSIGRAIESVEDQIKRILQRGQHPILLGSTGCGKTSAVESLIDNNAFWLDFFFQRDGVTVDQFLPGGFGMYYDTIGGAPSYGDADLFGLKMQVETIKGIISRAFERARRGEKVLIFLDEFRRFDPRVQNALMLALLPKRGSTAKRLGIDYDGMIYLTEAPIWGIEWAPAANVIWILGSNEWGAPIDPALARRVQACFVDYSSEVLSHLDTQLADFIKETWKLTDAGLLPLPIEYGRIALMRNPLDVSILPDYLLNLRLIDRSYQVQVQMLLSDYLKDAMSKKNLTLPALPENA